MNRRKFIQYSLGGILGSGIVGGLYAWQIEPFHLEFVKVAMPIKNLPAHLEGKILMQISDIHIGDRFDYQFIITSLQKASTYNPDFVVYTGDYISLSNKHVQFDKLDEVFYHFLKGKLGTYAILGNHDYGLNWSQADIADQITSKLQKNNITVLRNQHTHTNGLHFIGFDDYWGLDFNPQKALELYDASKATIVLCHNPDVCDLDVWGNYNSWILSGHTHGGQVKPPFLEPPMLPVKNKKYTSGLIQLSNNRTLYINRALGHLWQVRFNVKPEITLFTLKAA